MKINKLIVLSIVIVGACFFYQLRKDYVTYLPPDHFSPDTTLFAFDLHEVIFMPNIGGMITIFWHELPTSSFLFLFRHPTTFSRLWHYRKQIFEKILIDLASEYPETAALLPLVRTMTNAQYVNNDTVALVKHLKQQGYKIYLLSNIEEITLQQLVQKIPVVKELFDGFFIPSAANHWLAKPHVAFYENFKNYLVAQRDANKKIIFIDNSKVNIINAQKTGMYGILFTSAKALHDLLYAHGIF
jgi:FMN phosphatase YigB (HAD superfamily)